MTRVVWLWLAFALACGSAGASRPQIVPDDDIDVAAGWNAYRANDQARALTHYRRAADRNNRVAQFNLAIMLLAGEGTTADPWSGVAWLRKSAELGFARAQFALALLYEKGEHVTRSQDEATAWFRKAAEQNHLEAQIGLATQYFLGRGVSRDFKQAAQWYERAADQGDEASAYIVASLYENCLLYTSPSPRD